MTTHGHEFSGKTVEDAVADGLQTLGVTEDQVEIEVISKGSRGILGFGSEPATVRLTLISTAQPTAEVVARESSEDEIVENAVEDSAMEAPAVEEDLAISPQADLIEADVDDMTLDSMEDASVPETADETALDEEALVDEADALAAQDPVATDVAIDDEADEYDDEIDDEALAELAAELLAQLVKLMGFDATIETGWQEPDETTGSPYLLLDIHGDDLGALIGRRGETLTSIQYLLRLMVNQQVKQWKNIVVDVEQYKQRRIAQLSQLAERMARQVAETGRSVSLEPMPGNERRIVHITLRDDPDVYTESTGEGERRKVTIFPQD